MQWINDVVKKSVFDKLAKKVNNIDTSRFVLKNKNDTDKTELENRNPDTNELFKKTDYNGKIAEIEGKITTITGFATTSALSAVEIKIPNGGKTVEYGKKFMKIKIWHQWWFAVE